jgi:AcrR family transcriptional regulator
MSAPKRTRLSRVEQQAQTRAALLDAAVRVFTEHGLAGASVEAIAAAAGYSRGAFYSNFESKEQLFAELLQRRVFDTYRRLAADSAEPSGRPTARALGERAAAIQKHPQGSWTFRLWLELLAHAGRDKHFRKLAAEFWAGTRTLGAYAIAEAYDAVGREPPVAPDHLATAMIALDVGLAIQHFVDPQAVPLELYPEVFEALFGPYDPAAD